MRKVFRFWGYGCDVYADMVGDDGPLQPVRQVQPEPVFCRITLGDEMLARSGPLHDLCAVGWWTWLVLDFDTVMRGEPVAWVTLPDGQRRPLVTRESSGHYRFGFDVDESLTYLENECFLSHEPPIYVKLGIVPSRFAPWLRKGGFRALALARKYRSTPETLFPATPADPSVDSWRYIIRSLVSEFSVAKSMPFWPDGKTYAVVLTHDIDSDYSLRDSHGIDQLRSIEEAVGMRSAWMVVGNLVRRGRAILDDLCDGDHEIGSHGTLHDHRLAFLPPHELAQRVGHAANVLERYGSIGLRSPNFLRTPALYRAIDGWFEYDMSMHSSISCSSGLTPMNEGCCTYMPFFIDQTDVLEIPTTIPEDWVFDLHGVCQAESRRQQLAAIERIKAVGGVASFLTHPEPGSSLRSHWIELYRDIVGHVARDENAWLARPDEVNAHWRARRERIDELWIAEPIADRPLYSRYVPPKYALR